MQNSILSGLTKEQLKDPHGTAVAMAKARAAQAIHPRRRGRPQNGIADPGERAKILVAEHGTQAILAALKDEEKLAEFSTYDAMLIMGIANSLKGNGDERERMFNRMFGKVPDKQINLNLNVDVSPDQLTTRADKLLDDLGDDESDLIEG